MTILSHGAYKAGRRQLYLHLLSILLLELVQVFCDQTHGSFNTTLEVAMHLVSKASSEIISFVEPQEVYFVTKNLPFPKFLVESGGNPKHHISALFPSFQETGS